MSLARAIAEGNRRAREHHAWLTGKRVLVRMGGATSFVLEIDFRRFLASWVWAIHNHRFIEVTRDGVPYLAFNPRQVVYATNRPSVSGEREDGQ